MPDVVTDDLLSNLAVETFEGEYEYLGGPVSHSGEQPNIQGQYWQSGFSKYAQVAQPVVLPSQLRVDSQYATLSEATRRDLLTFYKSIPRQHGLSREPVENLENLQLAVEGGNVGEIADDTRKHAEAVFTAPEVAELTAVPLEGHACLQKYEGTIISRDGDSFWARLWENRADFKTIEAEFDITDLPISDRPLALEGAPLVWTLGYLDRRGTQTRTSVLYVRRIPKSSKDMVDKKANKIAEMMRAIPWE